MTKPLARRIALVTGASRGIGHSTALALAREGAHVVATARTVGGLEELDDTVKAAGGTATLVPLDLRDSEGIARLAAALDERYGKLDVLVGNAALGASNSPLDHFHPKEWDEVLGVNVTANWHLIRFFNPLLHTSDAGRAVFVTSGSSTTARAYRGLYAASKAALDERYGKLDVLVGNAALGASNSPLDHFHPKEWDEVLGVNVTANWHLIRFLNPLLKKSDAGRVVFITSGSATNARPYRGLYGVSKAALDLMARTYAAESASTPIKVNLFNPGPTRTKMRAAVMPGEDPKTLPHPDEVAAAIVPLCLPNFKESGKLYDFRARKLLSFKPPE